jgi:hypothetical protein
MAKPAKEKSKATGPAKKTTRGQARAAEYASCLMELHKLQGVLLSHLQKEI